MLQDIATTAMGVGIGHFIGRSLSSMFGGSDHASETTETSRRSCEMDSNAFNECMERNNDQMSLCQFYWDTLKACRSA